MKYQNKYYLYRIFIVVLFLCLLVSICRASRPGIASRCAMSQKKIFRDIWGYWMNNNLEGKPVRPGEEFKKLEEKLVEAKILSSINNKPSNDCSYGIDYIDGELSIFCTYHGNSTNADKHELMQKSYKQVGLHFGWIVLIVCYIISFTISCIKSLFKIGKGNKNKNQQ